MERAFQHLKLSHSQIENACRKFFQNKGSLESYEILSRGAANSTFKIRWDCEWYILRFYVRDVSLASIEKQIYQLIKASVPVPELLFIASDEEPYPFAIFRFCHKPHIDEISKMHSSQLSYDLGNALAKIHAFHFPKAGLFGNDLSIKMEFEKDSSPYFEYCLMNLIPGSRVWERLGDVKAKQIVTFMKEHQAFFPIIRKGGCLVHSDFKPANLLWDNSQGITILDWEFAHSGNGILDFGILLRHFRDFPLSIAHLEKGYRESGANLDSKWIQSARITDFVNMIQLLNDSSERPILFQSLIQSFDYTMTQWSTLLNG